MAASYKDYWAYKEVSKNWKSKVLKKSVTIFFEDGDVYAKFELKKDKDYMGRDEYYIYLDGQLLNWELEDTSTYDEAVKSCFYYFHTRF